MTTLISEITRFIAFGSVAIIVYLFYNALKQKSLTIDEESLTHAQAKEIFSSHLALKEEYRQLCSGIDDLETTLDKVEQENKRLRLNAVQYQEEIMGLKMENGIANAKWAGVERIAECLTVHLTVSNNGNTIENKEVIK